MNEIASTEYRLSENQVKKYSEFNLNALKSRGWTHAMIKKHLGDPDREASGRGTRGHSMGLYKKTRVFEAEAKEEWKEDRELAKKRGEIGKKVWESKGKPAFEKKKKARKDFEEKFWDVHCLTPETVRQIYNDQREKEKDYPEYDKATSKQVAELLYTYKRELAGGWLEHSTRRFIYAKLLKHISGNITDCWGGSDPYEELSKAEGFPNYASEPSPPSEPPAPEAPLEEGIPF